MKIALPAIIPSSMIRAAATLAVAATVVTSPVPAMAQDEVNEARLRKIEAEIRALQRNVFPGGDGRFFEPQISTADGATRPETSNRPSTTAVTDILARLDALELQLQRLTSISEENANAISLLDERIVALESRPVAALPTEAGQSEDGAMQTNLAAMTGGQSEEQAAPDSAPETAPPVETASAEDTGPSAARLAAVQEITKPQTDDPADDEYSYGFRLWNAGFYPEARQQLASFIEQYPDHWRITWGRNLLGRAFLDDGMAEEAARWFLRNYQADRTAPRAPDSLLFLAESMIAMDDTRRACIALSEFGDTYPAVASGRLADQYEANLRKVTCEG